jgi:hypothetical protein
MIVKDFRLQQCRKHQIIKRRRKYTNTTEFFCEQLYNRYFSVHESSSTRQKINYNTYKSDFIYPLLLEIANQHGILSLKLNDTEFYFSILNYLKNKKV